MPRSTVWAALPPPSIPSRAESVENFMESPLRHLCPTLESRECKQLNPFAQSTLRKLRWPLNSHLCFGLHWPADQSEGFKRANTWLASRLQTRQFLFGLRTVHTLLAGLTLPPLHELNLSFFLFPIWILVAPPPLRVPALDSLVIGRVR